MSNEASSREAIDYFDSHADYYVRSQYRTARRTFINGRHDTVVALLDSLPGAAGARVLDAGCGPGKLVAELARRHYCVVAMDTSPRMLEVARAGLSVADRRHVHYHVGSIEALPFADNSFDIVCSTGVIEYLKPCDRAIAELRRVLAPGGVLLLPTTNMLAPAHWLRRLLEPMARIPVVAHLFGIQPGNYRVWFHFIPRFKKRLSEAGLVLERERYFYLTVPRPLDRMFPKTAKRLESYFDRHMDTPIKHLAEGYVAVARKA